MTFTGQDPAFNEAAEAYRRLWVDEGDYESAWRWALSLSKDERASRFAAIVNTNRR